jgi:hypothetical protein
MYEQQPMQGKPQPSQPQMEAPSRPPMPPPEAQQGAPQGGGQDQAIAEAKQIVEAAGQDLGPFMDNPELAAKLQAALRLLTGQGGRPQQGGAPPR